MITRRTAALACMLFATAASFAGAQASKTAMKSGMNTTTAMSDADALIAHERSLYVAMEKNDFAAFNKGVGADYVSVDAVNGPMVWQLSKTADMLKSCKTGRWSVDNPQVTPVGSEIFVITATVSGEQVCDGMKSPSPLYTMSVWQKRGGRWIGLAHSETPIPPKK